MWRKVGALVGKQAYSQVPPPHNITFWRFMKSKLNGNQPPPPSTTIPPAELGTPATAASEAAETAAMAASEAVETAATVASSGSHSKWFYLGLFFLAMGGGLLLANTLMKAPAIRGRPSITAVAEPPSNSWRYYGAPSPSPVPPPSPPPGPPPPRMDKHRTLKLEEDNGSGQATPPMADRGTKKTSTTCNQFTNQICTSSAGGDSYSDAGFFGADGLKEEMELNRNFGDDLRWTYEELQNKFYGLSEQNAMLAQSLTEISNLVQRWEEILDRVDMPSLVRPMDPEDKIQWLVGALSEYRKLYYASITTNKNLTNTLSMFQGHKIRIEPDFHPTENAVRRQVQGLVSDARHVHFEHFGEMLSKQVGTYVSICEFPAAKLTPFGPISTHSFPS
ncbi:hypothetical protein ACP275_10G157400 [Erythranthe tilingii]